MATNLLIAYPQITIDATTVTTSTSADSSYPIANCITGARANGTQLASAATSSWVKFDLGASSSKTIEYLIVAGAKSLKAAGSKKCLLDGSTDDVSYTNICGAASTFQSLSLYGPHSEDLIFTSDLGDSVSGTLPATISYRYWRFWAAGEGTEPSKKWPFSKVYFGSWFDFGRDPIHPRVITKRIRTGSDRQSFYGFTFTWEGITSAKLNEAFSKFLGNQDVPIFLYTSLYSDVLLDHTLVHCTVASYTVTPVIDNTYTLQITFEELI